VSEQLIFELTNAFRAANSLSKLTWNDKLAGAARSHSQDMADRNFFDHINPDGKGPTDRAEALGYSWKAYAENISSGYQNAVSAVDGWINSPGHRGNLLTTTCNEIGVGWIESGESYGTQDFGNQR
jgi:uncharacterized protein YkwD